jgi:hypothetical protein
LEGSIKKVWPGGQGRLSYLTTLPKEFVERNDLAKNGYISIEDRGSLLIIRPVRIPSGGEVQG